MVSNNSFSFTCVNNFYKLLLNFFSYYQLEKYVLEYCRSSNWSKTWHAVIPQFQLEQNVAASIAAVLTLTKRGSQYCRSFNWNKTWQPVLPQF